MPPEAPLLFEVTLLEVRDGPDPQRLPPAARLRLGAQRRERGNFHFARGDFAAALRSYRLALRALDGPAAGETGRGGGRVAGAAGRRGCGALRPRSPRSPARAAGGRGAAGAARQVPQQLRGRRAEAAAGGRGAGGLRGGAEHQPGQRPGPAPAGAGEPRAAPRRPGSAARYRPLLSPQLLAQQGREAEAALVLRRALELDPTSKVWPGGAAERAGVPPEPGSGGHRDRRGSRRSPSRRSRPAARR